MINTWTFLFKTWINDVDLQRLDNTLFDRQEGGVHENISSRSWKALLSVSPRELVAKNKPLVDLPALQLIETSWSVGYTSAVTE